MCVYVIVYVCICGIVCVCVYFEVQYNQHSNIYILYTIHILYLTMCLRPMFHHTKSLCLSVGDQGHEFFIMKNGEAKVLIHGMCDYNMCDCVIYV